jgi:hypothetical protein
MANKVAIQKAVGVAALFYSLQDLVCSVTGVQGVWLCVVTGHVGFFVEGTVKKGT